MDLAPESHRRFLNAYYGPSRHIYDLTRKYYLFGRDRALDGLKAETWSTLVEIGPGTGRNLRVLRRDRPGARLGGVEPCDEMLGHARERCPWAALQHGFAESADLTAVHGTRPDRVLFSYCLSMVSEPAAATEEHGSLLGGAVGSLIGIVGFCALIALMAVIVSGPGIMPRTMICGLAFFTSS